MKNHKITIKLNGTITNAGEFETREALDAWVEKHQAKGTFGKPERYEPQQVTIQPLVLDEMGNILQEEIIEERNVLVPSEWTYEYEDLTETHKAREGKEKKRKEAKLKVKNLTEDGWKNVNTIAEVKAILKDLIDALDD